MINMVEYDNFGESEKQRDGMKEIETIWLEMLLRS